MELLVAFILNYCEPNDWQCYDHFVNCMVNKSGQIVNKNTNKCVKDYEKQ